MDEEAKSLWDLKRDEKERRKNKVSKFNRKVIVPEVGMTVLMQDGAGGPAKPGRYTFPAVITAIDENYQERRVWIEV